MLPPLSVLPRPLLGLLFGILSFLAQPARSQPAGQPAPTPTAALDTLIARHMRQAGLVGVGAALVVNKEVVWLKGYGYADRERGRPFTPQTVMNVGSITKTLTGVCLLRAVEAGQVVLDEDINQYLPFRIVNPHCPTARITLRHLATHTSGLADRYPFYTDSTYYYGRDSPEALGEFLRQYFVPGGRYYSAQNFLAHPPGTYRDYSNIGAGLVGYIVERRTGQRLSDYSRRHVLRPLKMKHSGWFLAQMDTARHARLYDKTPAGLRRLPLYGATTYPDGGLRTSVAELARFFCCLLRDGEYQHRRILRPASVQELMRYQFTSPANTPANVNPAKLNSGLFWATKFGGTRIGHGGSDPGLKTEMLADLSKEVGVILFTNTTLLDADAPKYIAIYTALYQYGQSLRTAAQAAP